MTIRNQYQVSEGGVWTVRQARLQNSAPTPTQPAALLGTNGKQLTGTVLAVDDTADIATIDFRPGRIYAHNVRNVVTYSGGAENTFAQLNEGMVVYYDRSSTMPADYFLSLAASDKDGNANPIFGYIVAGFEGDTFPKGAATATSVADVPISQVGAGAG
jgi:hypothetical protein